MDATTAASLYTQLELPALSLTAIALILLICLPAMAVLGYWGGRTRRRMLLRAGEEIDHVVGETTLAAILALLGLLLAFSFGDTLSLAQARKAATVKEAAALGTAFLRADYLPEAGRLPLQQALLDYTETRLLPGNGALDSQEAAQAFLERSLAAQARLWPLTLEATTDSEVAPPIQAFVAGAVNEAIDAHLFRLQMATSPMSEVTHIVLLASGMMGLFLLGNRAGLLGRRLTWRIFVFSGFLFVVMFTIVDTQRAKEGLVRADEMPLRATLFDMHEALAAGG
ncbi:hypothetical protein [Salipiger sp.]|uniref:bestrophin-like domain n=1 Tax=Salipiger sp. TaxID=2078585 RepID=UPI003A97163E